MALAREQHSLGISDPFITGHAFRIIDGEDLTEWGGEARRRKTALESLRRKLLEDLPSRKVVRPRKFIDRSFDIGKHFLYTEESSRSKLILRSVNIRANDHGRYSHFTVLDWDGNSAGLQRPDLLSPVRQDWPLDPRQIYIGITIYGGRVKKANLVELPTTVHVETPGDYGSHMGNWADLVQLVQYLARGTGLGGRAMRLAQQVMRDEARVCFGFLGCRPEVVPFYEATGWIQVHATERCLSRLDQTTVVVSDDGPNLVCTAMRDASEWPHGDIDLRGTPW